MNWIKKYYYAFVLLLFAIVISCESKQQTEQFEIEGVWLNTDFIANLQQSKSVLSSLNKCTGFPLLTFEKSANNTYIRMLSEFHDSAYDSLFMKNAKLIGSINDTTTIIDNCSIIWTYANYKTNHYTKIYNSINDIGQQLNVFLVKNLFEGRYCNTSGDTVSIDSTGNINGLYDYDSIEVGYDFIAIPFGNMDFGNMDFDDMDFDYMPFDYLKLYVKDSLYICKYVFKENQLILTLPNNHIELTKLNSSSISTQNSAPILLEE